jgi:hypothetical protein
VNNNETILGLQNQISRLQGAGTDRASVIRALIDTNIKYPVEHRMRAYFIRRRIPFHHVDFNKMQYVDILNRKSWYIGFLQDELGYIQSNSVQFVPWADSAISLLFLNPPQFTADYVLYDKDGKKLSVSDLLSVVGYTVKFIETIGVKFDERFSIALQTLNVLDLILHNKKQDKPFNKSLHILNDVLADAAKDAKIKGVSDSQISGISLLFDVAIDFLVKE